MYNCTHNDGMQIVSTRVDANLQAHTLIGGKFKCVTPCLAPRSHAAAPSSSTAVAAAAAASSASCSTNALTFATTSSSAQHNTQLSLSTPKIPSASSAFRSSSSSGMLGGGQVLPLPPPTLQSPTFQTGLLSPPSHTVSIMPQTPLGLFSPNTNNVTNALAAMMASATNPPQHHGDDNDDQEEEEEEEVGDDDGNSKENEEGDEVDGEEQDEDEDDSEELEVVPPPNKKAKPVISSDLSYKHPISEWPTLYGRTGYETCEDSNGLVSIKGNWTAEETTILRQFVQQQRQQWMGKPEDFRITSAVWIKASFDHLCGRTASGIRRKWEDMEQKSSQSNSQSSSQKQQSVKKRSS